MGIPLEQVTLQMSRGISCALLPCTPHAGAGLKERDAHRNLRIHIVLFHLPPDLPTSEDQASAAYISPPILPQFCGKTPTTQPHRTRPPPLRSLPLPPSKKKNIPMTSYAHPPPTQLTQNAHRYITPHGSRPLPGQQTYKDATPPTHAAPG